MGVALLAEQTAPVRVGPMDPAVLLTVADLHLAAYADYTHTRLGKRYVVSFLGWFLQDPEGIALVASDSGRLAGYVVGAPLGYRVRLTRATLPAAVAGALRRPWIVLDRRIRRIAWVRIQEAIRAWRGEPGTGAANSITYSLVSIAVAPEARGRQLSRVLMEAFEAEARGRGARRLCLSVHANNAPARSLYEKAGWTLACHSGEDTLCYSKTLQ